MVFLVGTAAALMLALGYVLQQRTAAHAAEVPRLSYRLLWWLMHKPVWWGGIGCMVAGQLLGGLALQLASVALVEPLLSTSLVFAFAISAYLSDRRVRWYEIGGALLVSAALGVFIAVGDPHTSREPASRPVTALAVVVLGAVVVGLVVVAGRRGLVVESVLLALGAGLLYGLQDVSTRAVLVDIDHSGIATIVSSFWVYVLLAAAVVGIGLAQSAFRAARLDYSLPPIAIAEPVAGIALGVSLLGDSVSVTTTGLAVEAACLAAMVVGVVLVGKSDTLARA